MAITIPNTFDADTTIVSDEVDENFAELAAKALDKTGDTITGNIAVSNGITIDGVDLSAMIPSGSAQPGFLAFTSTGSVGAGSGTLAFDEEEYDTANNFVTNTFTAPVTGLYLFFASIHLTNVTGTAYLDFSTTASSYQLDARAGSETTLKGLIVVPMTATDTASLSITVTGTVDIEGDTYPISYFGGRLLV
jgi:hypothetical protein